MTPSEVAELILLTVGVAEVDERRLLLVVRTALMDDAVRLRWLALRSEPPEFLEAVSILEADGDADLEETYKPSSNEIFRITIEKRDESGQLRLFLSSSLGRLSEDVGTVDHVLVADMRPDETFTNGRNRVQLWSVDRPDPFSPLEPLPDPRAFASDFTGHQEVCSDVRPWILRNEPETRGRAFFSWADLATRRLLAALSDRVAVFDGHVRYHFSGPPACLVDQRSIGKANLFSFTQSGAAWVFLESRDADTRHLLLAAEWARSYRKDALAELGEGALESAKAAYAAYVKAGSRETLKALSELRKALVDEAQKISQRAQDLAGAIWKDLAVAAAPFALKALPGSAPENGSIVASVFAIMAAMFLLFSFFVQVYINDRYFKNQDTSRQNWRRALSVAISPREIAELGDGLIRSSISDYERIRLLVGLVYAVLIAALVGFFVVTTFPSVTECVLQWLGLSRPEALLVAL